MHTNKHKSEKGVALIAALLALLLLTAIGMGMMYMSTTESAINSNFKAEETAYFAARAGVEEVRDRMLAANPNTIATLLPPALPGGTNGVLYVLQTGVAASDVTNLTASNPLADDELCHDFSFGGMTPVPANVRCSTQPAGGGWFTTTPSVAPFALDYKWVRVTLKANSSTAYTVDAGQPAANQVCWNGISEVALPSGVAACNALNPIANPVYMVTSLAVTPSGARRLVQQEISQTPIQGFPYGVFATGTGCGALGLGGGSKTFSFNSSTENPPSNPPSNATTSGGNIGSNGNITVDGTGTSVNGTTSSAIGGVGTCNKGNGITVSGGATYGTPATIPVQTLPVPPMPNPLPPTNNTTINSSGPLPPGAYGNVNVTGGATITLAGGTPGNPAVYTFNSFSMAGGSTLVINGPVVFNMAGVKVTNVVDFSGGGFQNTTNVAANFVINYGGSAKISLNGGSAAFAVINAPNASITLAGGSNFYGQIIGNTISDTGGTNIYFDQSLNTPSTNNNAFYEISLRELSY